MSVRVELRNSLVFSKFSEFFSEEEPSMYPRKVGIKATEMEFSAKSLLSRFGIIKAMPKASANFEVPRKEAFVISRTSPKILEHKVKKESDSPEAIRDFL